MPVKRPAAAGKARKGKKKVRKPAPQIRPSLRDSLFRPGPGPVGKAPWRLIGLLLLAAWIPRAAVALVGDFMLHPDEIYQYLEPAHGLVFGNAIYTWEMMFGARSFLIPWFIAGVLFVMKFLGLGEPAYYIPVVKLVLCTISLSLPVAMYFTARGLWSERTGLVALCIGCFWYEFVGFAHKPMSDFLSCYAAMASIAFACARDRTTATVVCSGLLAALTIGLRWQLGIMLVPFALMLLWDLDNRRRAQYVGAGLAGMAIVGLLDHLAWGGFFHSVYLNIVSNLKANKLLDIDYQAEDYHFLLWTAWASVGLFWVTVALAAREARRYLMPLVLLAIFFATHSFLVHKEYRFAFPWMPLWLLMASDMVSRLAAFAAGKKLPRKAVFAAAGAVGGVMSAVGIANALPYQEDLYRGYSKEEIKISFLEPDPHLSLYRKLSRDGSLEGLIELSRPLPSSGGYYYLHRKVALLPPNILAEIAMRTGGWPPHNEWATHVVKKPRDKTDPRYEIVERSPPYYTLTKVKPEYRTPVFPLKSHIYAPDLLVMLSVLPFLREYMPKDRSYLVNFRDP